METMSDRIRDFTDSLNNYLNQKKFDSNKYKTSLAPTKTLEENLLIRHLEPCKNLDGMKIKNGMRESRVLMFVLT